METVPTQTRRALVTDAAARRDTVTDPEDTAEPRVASAQEFAGFYREHHRSIARALAFTLGDTELGAEAADEGMARAYTRWSALREYDRPAGWVYRVGLNWARSLHRRLARRLPFREATEVTQPPIADPAIAQALRDLDVGMRAVVVCRLLLDWSVEDTATALGLKPGTVKSRLHRALRVLENTLDHLR